MKTTWMVGILLVLASAGRAPASTLTVFNFSGPILSETNVEGVAIASESGPGLTVTPFGGLIGGTTAQNDQVDVILGDWGLGLLNNNVTNDRSSFFRRVHVDGNNSAEVIRLEFSRPIKVDQVRFSFVGPFETFDLALDGVDVDVVSLLGTDSIYELTPAGMAKGLVNFPDTLPFASTWEFFARGSADEWNIEGLSAAQVPEPSSLVALASLAFCGLIAARYRRRAS